MEDEAFKLRALGTATSILKEKKNKQNARELDFVIGVLEERRLQIKIVKEEEIGVA